MRATILLFVAAGMLPVPALAKGSDKAQSATLETVLAKHFEAMGGVERLKSLKSVSVTFADNFDGKSATLTVARMRPNLMRYEHNDGSVTTVKAFDGSAGWMLNKEGTVEAITGEKLAGMKAKAQFDDVLLDPAASGATVELAGKEMIGDSKAFAVRVKHAGGTEETRYIDAKSFLEVKRTVSWAYEGKSGTKTITFRDYKPVNGIMTAMTRDIESDGKRGTSTIARVAYDAGVSVASFQMPKHAKPAASKALPASTR